MTLSVYAPASIGNVGVGFDLLGAAVSPIDGGYLGDVVSIVGDCEDDFQLSLEGPFVAELPQDPRDNVVYQCCHYFRDALINRLYQRMSQKLTQRFSVNVQAQTTSVPYLILSLNKNLPVGSGLGSSATSIVATLQALNLYFHQPFEAHELLAMMGHFEGQLSGSIHYDNVAPCFLGGIQLMTGDESVCRPLPVPEDWYWVMAYSGVNVSTKMAREVLPKAVTMAVAIEYARNLAVFVDCLHHQQWQKAASFVIDPIAEPYRRDLLPGFATAVEQLKAMGALACGISGSGPSLFAVAQDLQQAQQFEQYLLSHYIQSESGFCRICTIDTKGARVVPPEDDTAK